MSIPQKKWLKQCGLSITLFLWSIRMDCVISEMYYKGTILQRSYRKNDHDWSFSYNSFVKFHGKKLEATAYNIPPIFFVPRMLSAFLCLMHILKFKFLSYKQTLWTVIRLLP